MDIQITGKHIDVTEPMDRHIRQHIARLPKYADLVQYMIVTLRMDSGNLASEIIAKCPRADLFAEGKDHDFYKSIDAAFSKIEHRLTRYHDKLVKNRAREGQKASEMDKRRT